MPQLYLHVSCARDLQLESSGEELGLTSMTTRLVCMSQGIVRIGEQGLGVAFGPSVYGLLGPAKAGPCLVHDLEGYRLGLLGSGLLHRVPAIQANTPSQDQRIGVDKRQPARHGQAKGFLGATQRFVPIFAPAVKVGLK